MHLGASSRPARTRGLFFALAVAAMFLFAAPAGATSSSKGEVSRLFEATFGAPDDVQDVVWRVGLQRFLSESGIGAADDGRAPTSAVTTPVSNNNTWDGRFYDNGHYIGHDEPDVTFLSNLAGLGQQRGLDRDAGHGPGRTADGLGSPEATSTHWFQLISRSVVVDVSVRRQLLPADPVHAQERCERAQRASGRLAALARSSVAVARSWRCSSIRRASRHGSTAVGCDDTHWCSALTIDSLECTQNFVQCNPQCEEPLNFAFIQRNGIPAGPPSPQDANVARARRRTARRC